jgi:hypothetical protein
MSLCARAQFSGCCLTTSDHSETRQIAFCCQNLMLDALNSRSALSMLAGTLFKKFGLFFNTPLIFYLKRLNYSALQVGVIYK